MHVIKSSSNIYELYKNNILGNGSYSIVYMGKRFADNKNVAIKYINLKNLNFTSLKMIQSEIEITKKLLNHDNLNILKYYDIVENDDSIYIIMEYCESGNLSSILTGDPIDENLAKNYFKQLVWGLLYLKENNIAHRDIKPTNILINNNILKICDFGFASQTDKSKKMITVCGSPLYMAPEVYKKSGYDESVDVWALGIILYEMIYGFHPLYEYCDITILSKSLISNNDVIIFPSNPTVEKSCIDLLKKILNKNCCERISLNEILKNDWLVSHSSNENKSEDKEYIMIENNGDDNISNANISNFNICIMHDEIFEMDD